MGLEHSSEHSSEYDSIPAEDEPPDKKPPNESTQTFSGAKNGTTIKFERLHAGGHALMIF